MWSVVNGSGDVKLHWRANRRFAQQLRLLLQPHGSSEVEQREAR